jgi:hypothetical protein
MKRRKIEIISLTNQTLIIRNPALPFVARCIECMTTMPMVTPEQAAIVARVNPRAIYRWVEAGTIHFVENSEGVLLVCPNSLPVNAGHAQIVP